MVEMIVDPLTKPQDTNVFLEHREATLKSTGDVTLGVERKLTDSEKKVTENKSTTITLQDLKTGLKKIFAW